MSFYTLNDVQTSVANKLGEGTVPAVSSSDYLTRTSVANAGLREWQSAYEWKALSNTATLNIPLGGTSVSLPTDYKPNSIQNPIFLFDSTGNKAFFDYKSLDQRLFFSPPNRIVYESINPITQISILNFQFATVSGADQAYTLPIVYRRIVPVLVNSADPVYCSNIEWLVNYIIYTNKLFVDGDYYAANLMGSAMQQDMMMMKIENDRGSYYENDSAITRNNLGAGFGIY